MRTVLSDLAAKSILPIRRSSWISGEYVRAGEYLRRAQHLYETGVVLGHYFHERLDAFIELISEPGQEVQTRAALIKSAAAQLERTDGNPKDFYDLFFRSEAERLMSELREAGRTKYSNWSDVYHIVRKKLPVPQATTGLELAARKGTAFGSQNPHLAEKLLVSPPDPENWSRVRAGGGADWPATPPAPCSLSELQSQALAVIRPYVQGYRFDLLARLGLWFETEDSTYVRWRALMARRENQ